MHCMLIFSWVMYGLIPLMLLLLIPGFIILPWARRRRQAWLADREESFRAKHRVPRRYQWLTDSQKERRRVREAKKEAEERAKKDAAAAALREAQMTDSAYFSAPGTTKTSPRMEKTQTMDPKSAMTKTEQVDDKMQKTQTMTVSKIVVDGKSTAKTETTRSAVAKD